MLLYFLYTLRIILTLSPQHGYIQPDEFFQFTEPIANTSLGCNVTIPWELKGSQPIRNMFAPYVISQTAFTVCKLMSSDPSPYLLLVMPRLLFTLLSFSADWSVHRIVSHLSQQVDLPFKYAYHCQVVFASSHVVMTYLTHTFTNSLELILFALLLQQVVCSTCSRYSSTTIGILMAIGFFNRPTFLAFLFIPLVYLYTHTSVRRMMSVTFTSLVTSTLLILFDTMYYKYNYYLPIINTLNMQEILNQVKITPINFLLYNSKTSNLANHGLHPRYLHQFNLFIIGLTLTLYLWCDLIQMMYKLISERNVSSLLKLPGYKKLLLASLITSVSVLSIFPHQEVRFLLPCYFILTILYGDKLLQSGSSSLCLWIILNVSFTYFYGFVHQAGVTKSLFWLHSHLRSSRGTGDERVATVIMDTVYMVPQHLLNLPSQGDQSIEMTDLSGKKFPDALDYTLELLSEREQCFSFVIIAHTLYRRQVLTLLTYWNLGGSASVITSFFPHFSAEVLSDCLMDVFSHHTSISDLFTLDVWSVKKCPQILHSSVN